MNFDDRLRNHLHTQTDDIVLTPEGVDGVRSRSRRRKQRRAGAATLTVAAIGIVGALALTSPKNEQANLATEGDDVAALTETTAAPLAEASASDTAPSTVPAEIALPEPGTALSLSTANNTDAPGGYNVYRSGRADGVYFVVSTAPGLTYEDTNGEYIRADTLYTFDGSQWSQNQLSDRFVSGFDSSTNGVLYAVSTGTPTSQELAVGRSSDGLSWDWTPIDLRSIFGDDQATWPTYSVQQTARGDQRLVVVVTGGVPDYETAFRLAQEAGAPIDSANQLANVSSEGLSWFEATQVGPCQAADNERFNELWDAEPEGPELDFGRDLTEAEQAELEAVWEAQIIRSEALRLEALEAAAAIAGCEEYVTCSTEIAALSADADARIRTLLASFGAGQFNYSELDDAQSAALDAEYQASSQAQEDWLASSGCADALGWYAEGEAEPLESSTWAELGVTVPDSWTPSQFGFVVDGESTTSLGELFPGQTGFLVDLDDVDGTWTATFDSTDYSTFEGVDAPIESQYVSWTSTDLAAWASAPTIWQFSPLAEILPNGVGLSISWAEEESQLFRSNADGSSNTLLLSDLAPNLDTSGYTLARVATGEYGAVVTAVNWSQLEEGGNYSSIVLYSPDGNGWGATEVPDVEVVEAIVGSEDVVLFLNDPNREPGSPQPILIGN